MPRIVVAMSGGVDSSVAAALLAEAGYETVGVTLRLLGSPVHVEDARRVCSSLGIRHEVVDSRQRFERSVSGPFVREYLRGRTPVPCVECNRRVKFGQLLPMARALGAESLATGHYARLDRAGGAVRLLAAADGRKDQAYFLHRLTQSQLRRALFPLGGMDKASVRRKARSLGLENADKADSQDVCFIPGGDYRSFVSRRSGRSPAPGEVRDRDGRVLGRHQGLSCYTVGQRKGLGLASRAPLYVTRLDAATNTLVVGTEKETFSARFRVGRLSWTRPGAAPWGRPVSVRVRHRARLRPASCARLGPRGAEVRLFEPERAVAPGQSAVFYDGEEVLGGGTIEEVL
ncbi:MAG: tRNA 2-thiouridine(34) synthase MnmA [Elusimicrobiota bacterium]